MARGKQASAKDYGATALDNAKAKSAQRDAKTKATLDDWATRATGESVADHRTRLVKSAKQKLTQAVTMPNAPIVQADAFALGMLAMISLLEKIERNTRSE